MSTTTGLTYSRTAAKLVGDASDSPVVDDEGNENQFFGGAVVSYSSGG